MNSEKKLHAWEFVSTQLEFLLTGSFPTMERIDLLDKYNFLALPGTKEQILRDTPLLVVLVISLPCKSSHLFCGQQCMVLSTLVAISSTHQFFSLDIVIMLTIMSDMKDISNDVHLLIFIEDPVMAGLIGYFIVRRIFYA
jgi:hypothetical protein